MDLQEREPLGEEGLLVRVYHGEGLFRLSGLSESLYGVRFIPCS